MAHEAGPATTGAPAAAAAEPSGQDEVPSVASTASLLDAAADDDGEDDSDAGEESEDDDDDDGEKKPKEGAAAEEKEEKAGTVAHLRGKLKPTEEGVVVFQGSWASDKADFADKAKTSKLKYETSLTKDQLRAGDIGDTSWDGYFLINEGLDEEGKPKFSKIKEEGIELTAKPSKSAADLVDVKGFGCNNIGAFKLAGVYNKATHQLMLTKQ
jgi:hypothetical protein